MDLGGWESEEDLGGVVGWETVIRQYYMKKKLFSIK